MVQGFLKCGRCDARMIPTRDGFDCLCSGICDICGGNSHGADLCGGCYDDVNNGLRVLIGGWNDNETPWTVLADSLGEPWNGFATPVFHSSVMLDALMYLSVTFYRAGTVYGIRHDGVAFVGEQEFGPDSDGNYPMAGYGFAWESYTR